MKTLQELRALVEFAKKFGQEPAPSILERMAALEADERKRAQREAEIRQRVAHDLTELFNLKEKPHELVQSSPSQAHEEAHEGADATVAQSAPQDAPQDTPQVTESIANRVAKIISESGVVAPDPVLARPGRNLEADVRRLEQWISRIAATGPGSGEVRLRYLDDVDRNSIQDHYYLRYDAGTKKFVFDTGHVNSFYLQAHSSLTQTSSATSATAMIFEATDAANGISVDGGNSSQIVLAHPGTYNLQFSVQLYNVGNAADRVYIWFAQNGSDIETSNSIVTVPAKDNANAPGAVIASWNFLFDTYTNNEFVQLKWFTNDETHTFLAAVSSQAATATTPYLPAVPSVIVTVSPVNTRSL